MPQASTSTGTTPTDADGRPILPGLMSSLRPQTGQPNTANANPQLPQDGLPHPESLSPLVPAAVAGEKPLTPDAESARVLQGFQNALPPELRGQTPNFSTVPVDRQQLSGLVAQERGNPAEFNAALQGLAGPNAQVASTPVVLQDGNGGTGTLNLFHVKGTDGTNYLMDSQGAHYSNFDDYLRNNPLPSDWTVTRPANLGDPTGDAGSLITSPAHPTTGFWPSVEGAGKWLTSTGRKLQEYGSDLNSATPTLSTGLGSAQVAAGGAMEFLGSVVTGVNSGQDLISRFQHGQGIGLSDPRAQADYLDVFHGAANAAALFGGALGAAGKNGAALGFAKSASVLAVPGVGNEAGNLYHDWDRLSPSQRVAQSAKLGATVGLLATPFAAGKLPKGEPSTEPRGGSTPVAEPQPQSVAAGGIPGTAANTTRVGRWMSQAEYDAMQRTGAVQEGGGGTTYVLNPASPEAYSRQAAPGTLYAEFDVPTSSLSSGGESGWNQIRGPNHWMSIRKQKMGHDLPEFPQAQNLKILGSK